MSGPDFVSADLQHIRQAFRPVHVVIDHQHATAGHRGLNRRGLGSRSLLGPTRAGLDQWKSNGEGASFAETRALGGNRPTVKLDQSLHQPRPMPSPP